jgi:zinc protease
MFKRLGAAAIATSLAIAASVTTWADDSAAKKAPPPAADQDPKIPFEKYSLDNGLEVILIQDNTVPLVAVSVWYHVGSGYEVPGKSGFAHLFEHMLFQGSKNVGNDRHFDILKKVGVVAVNGTTNSDRTNYFEVVPSNQLETALWLESDRMGYLLPTLTQESLDNQIDVVRNERRQRYDNQPYGKTLFAQYEALYPEGHPYRYLTIGKHEDLTSASLDDVKKFFETWYVPSNATLTITGDFDKEEAKALVTKWFASFPKSAKPKVVPVPAPAPRAVREEVKDEFAKLRRVQWAWHSPANFQPGDAELDLLAQVLAGNEAARLERLLVVEKQLAQDVAVYQASSTFSSTFNIQVTLRGEADLATVEKLVTAELERVRNEPVTDRELKRAVTTYEAQAIRGLEDLLARSERLQGYNHYLGDPDRISWDLDRYRNATADGIRDYAKASLDPKKAAVIVTLPGGAK